MSNPEPLPAPESSSWDWKAATRAHPIGRYGGLAWLADSTGVKRGTVYKYSTGERRATGSWLARAAAVLGHEGVSDGIGRRSGSEPSK